jgi:hypothetical protein
MFLLSGQLLQLSNLLLLQLSDEENDTISASRYNSLRESPDPSAAHQAGGAHMGLPNAKPL